MRFDPVDTPSPLRPEQPCTFCRRPLAEVGPVVTSGEWPVPGAGLVAHAAICEECVKACRTMFEATQGGPPPAAPPPAEGPPPRRPWWRFWG
jgi:hypothetical protein